METKMGNYNLAVDNWRKSKDFHNNASVFFCVLRLYSSVVIVSVNWMCANNLKKKLK